MEENVSSMDGEVSQSVANLCNKVALVTGAGAGIGAAIAQELGRCGATVAVNYSSNRERAESVVNDIEKSGGKALAVQGNVQEKDSVEQMLETIKRQLGAIDILVLSAAPPAYWTRFVDQQQDGLEDKLLAEMRSFFITARAVAGDMVERGSGSIVGLSSVKARQPTDGFSAQTVAKSAVEGLLRSMAQELTPSGVRVNIVAPSLTITPGTSWLPKQGIDQVVAHTPMNRLCSPEDVAKAVSMVASDDAGFISGAYIPVSGGMLLE